VENEPTRIIELGHTRRKRLMWTFFRYGLGRRLARCWGDVFKKEVVQAHESHMARSFRSFNTGLESINRESSIIVAM
jgi:hypothetical protein